MKTPMGKQPARGRVLAPPAEDVPVCPAAPRRGLDSISPHIRSMAPFLPEETLLEQVRQFGVKACQRFFSKVEVHACQELAPKIISQIAPPERCWLLHLVVSQSEGAWAGDEVQAAVFLADGALHLFFR